MRSLTSLPLLLAHTASLCQQNAAPSKNAHAPAQHTPGNMIRTGATLRACLEHCEAARAAGRKELAEWDADGLYAAWIGLPGVELQAVAQTRVAVLLRADSHNRLDESAARLAVQK